MGPISKWWTQNNFWNDKSMLKQKINKFKKITESYNLKLFIINFLLNLKSWILKEDLRLLFKKI